MSITTGSERQTRSGPGRRARSTRPAACLLAVVLAIVLAGPAMPESGQKNKSKKKDYSYALLFGTVFDEGGRLVRGAAIRVRQKDGKKSWEAASDVQGEFAVHLPAVPAVYLVEVSAPGFQADSKEVAFTGDERQDVVFRLARKQ